MCAPPSERQASLSAAAAAVDFRLFKPRILPADAQEAVHLYEPGGPPFPTGRVTLTYTPPSGRWGRSVTLMPVGEERNVQSFREDEEVVEEHGVRYELWTNAGATQLCLDRQGTTIVLRGAYPRHEMLRVARSLVMVDPG